MTRQLLSAPSEVTMLSHSEYMQFLRSRLRSASAKRGTCLDGWAGCGGLSLGFEAAGFRVTGYEMDQHAVATYRANLDGACVQQRITTQTEWPGADLFIGGPPCQPFSVTGNQHGTEDPRNGFPSFVAAVARIKPKAWLFENVPGMAGRAAPYFEHILRRLRRLGYKVTWATINAADYGVPQTRRRLVAIGTFDSFRLPEPPMLRTTSGAALGGLAHRALGPDRLLTRSQERYIARYEAKSQCAVPRDLHLDRPARTLTCRNLAGATGDMQRIHLANGQRRRPTVAEAARLQSFPPGFEFKGPESRQFTQIGNAVPPLVARALADALVEAV